MHGKKEVGGKAHETEKTTVVVNDGGYGRTRGTLDVFGTSRHTHTHPVGGEVGFISGADEMSRYVRTYIQYGVYSATCFL